MGADNDQIEDWLKLIHASGVGIARLRPLLDTYGSASALLAAGRSAWQAQGLDAPACEALLTEDSAGIERDLRWLQQPGNRLLPYTDDAYPVLLREIDRPPLALYCTGDLSLLKHPQLAIVGSRNPTRDGQDQAHDFAKLLASHGLGITSGLAMGIDAAAHEGALAADGITIAVFGTGLDRVYPSRHRDLATRIAARGLLVSEFPCGTDARAAHFPQRNRIVTGLSVGVLVVEAAERSGSLISARTAMEQGREVFAIPGSINNPLKRGCHRLIREGARLVETANDVVEEIGPFLHNAGFAPAPSRTTEDPGTDVNDKAVELDSDYQNLLNNMGFEPIRIDQLVQRSGQRVEDISSMLLMLELQGRVQQLPGGAYQQTPPNLT